MLAEVVFKIFGIVGVIALTFGVLNHKRKIQDILFLIGGILLITYSLFIKDLNLL